MIDWSRWLPGVKQDEEEDPVSRTLRTLQQGASDVGAGISQGVQGLGTGLSSAASSAGDALGSAATAVRDAYNVPAEERPPQYSGPSYAQPSLAAGQPSMLAQLPEVESAAWRGGADALGDRGALLAGLRQPETAEEAISTAAPAPYRAVQIASEVGQRAGAAGLGEYAERAAGTDPTFTTNPIETPLGTIPSVTGPTPRQVGEAVGSLVGDPTTYLGVGAANRAADFAIEQGAGALRGVARRVVGKAAEGLGAALGRNADNVAAADARMAAEGSTALPATFGALPEPGSAGPAGRTVEVLQEQLDTATAAWQRAREAGDERMAALAREHAVALEGDLVDARNARQELEPRIRSDVGARVESLPLAEETADTLSGAGSRRADIEGLGGPVSHVPSPINLNATTGVAPEAATRGAGALGAVNRALGEGIAGGVGGAVIEQATDPGSPQGEDEPDADYAARRARERVQRAGTGFAAGAVGFPAATRLARGAARLAGARGAEEAGGALGTLGAAPNPSPNISPLGSRLMDTYDVVTPQRVERSTARALDVTSGAIARLAADGGHPAPPADLVGQVHAAVVRNLEDTKTVMTGIRPGAIKAFLRGEGLTSKVDTGDLDTINRITQQQVNVAGGRAGRPYTLDDAAEFAQRESEQMRMATGGTRFPDPETGAVDTEAPRVMYAYVGEGQPLVGPNRPTAWIVWDDDTPRVTTAHHAYALGSPHQDIHDTMPPGLKAAIYAEDAVKGGRTGTGVMQGGSLVEAARGVEGQQARFGWEGAGVDVGEGRRIADTDWLVGPSGESAMRANGLVLGMPGVLQQAIADGRMTDPEQIAAVLMRGGAPQWKSGWASVMNPSRSESLIIDPDISKIKAIYLTATPKNLETGIAGTGSGAGKSRVPNLTERNFAHKLRNDIKAQTGRDVTILWNDITQAGAPRAIADAEVLAGPPLAVAPGRSRIVGRYTQATNPSTGQPYTDIGSGLVARHGADLGNAAQGAVLGAASEDLQAQQEGRDPDPTSRLARGAIGAGLGYVAGRAAPSAGRALGSGVVPTRRAAAAAAAGTPATAAAAPDLSATLAKIPGLKKAFGGAEARAAAMKAAGKDAPSVWEWMKQAGYAGIYGPATAVNSAIGGAQELLLAQPKEAVRALVEGRPVVSRGAARRQAGAAREGLAGFKRVLAGGDAETAARASGGSQGTAGLSDRIANPIGHLAARALERPGELLTEAPDAIFRPAFLAQGEEREAQRIAKEAGFTGDNAASFVDTLLESAQRLKANPNARSTSDEARRVVEAGKQYADQLGYKGEPGKLGKYLADLSKRDDGIGVLASFLMPFPSMASRMTTAAGRSTPVVGLLPTFRRGQSRFDTVYDQAFGSLVAAGIAGWAYEGGITGSGPDDPDKRAELQAQGWQPNSVLVGGHYLPSRAFGRYQPLLDAAGEIHDSVAYQKPGDKKAMVLDLAKRAGSLATDQAGLSGLADLYDMFVNDKGATFPGWAARSAMRYVPGGGILRAGAAAADPQARRPERWAKDETVPTTAIGQNLETAIPGLRQNVPAAQDVLGRPAENPQQGLGAVIPRTTTQREDPLIKAYLDAGVDIGMAPAAIGGVTLTPAQQRRWMTARGQELRAARAEVLGARSLPPAERQAELRRILGDAAQAARESVEPTFTERQWHEAERKKAG